MREEAARGAKRMKVLCQTECMGVAVVLPAVREAMRSAKLIFILKISGLKPEVATPSNIWRTILVNSIRVVIHLKYLEDRGHGIVTARGSRLVAANRAAIDSFLSSRATNL